ncbi:hypothetical protein [Natronomonas sp. EA1]|uniref:hypothetical protein n=1 Tax=Natronomonas sp. EA1 TaxID=3421655 RepID=UPI003EBEC646
MTDRGTLALVAGIALVAITAGPLVSAVSLPPAQGGGSFSGFGDTAEVSVDHRLSFDTPVVSEAATLSRDGDSYRVALPGTRVAVTAGDSPVLVSFRLHADDRTARSRTTVPAGSSTVVEPSFTGRLESAPANATLVVSMTQGNQTFPVDRRTLPVEVRE